MYSYFIVGNKIFCFSKKNGSSFFRLGYISGGWAVTFSRIFKGVTHKLRRGGGGLADLEYVGGGLGKKG